MATALLPGAARLRGLLIAVLSAAAILAVTQLLLPGTTGGENGTPAAILFSGANVGLLNALIAIGIVLIYRSSRIINFAQAALGGIGGAFTYNFAVRVNWPFLLAAAAGLVVAGLVGMIVELGIIRRFFNAPRLVLTVLTIALVGVLNGARVRVSSLPIFGDVQDITLEEIAGAEEVSLPFADFHFRVGDFPLDFGFGNILVVGASILAMLGLAAFLRYSRSGVAIRAVAENAERAPLLGIAAGKLSMVVWTIAGLFSGLGIILTTALTSRLSIGDASPQILITALAAAVIARMRSLPAAALAAVGITVLREAVNFSFEEHVALLDVGLLVVITFSLLFHRRRAERSEAFEASSWKATEEYRAIPKELLGVGGIRMWRWVLIAIGLVGVLVYPLLVPSREMILGGYTAIVAIVMLSLVVLTGWAGQVSLGQFALVAVGALIGGALTSKMGITFWIAVLIVPFLTAGFSVLLGLPALRIRGLFLGVATLALAFAVHSALFNDRYFGWLLSESVERPAFLLLDFQDERSMYYLTVVALVIAIMLVTTLRRSRVGRVLIGLRDNEPNAQSFGVNVIRTRLAAFALSGFLCGFAGVLLAHHQRAVQQVDFEVQVSLDIFLFAVIGGVGSVAGAVLGAIYFAVQSQILGPPWNFLIGNLGLLAILYVAPGGLASLAYGLRDGVLRIVAQRRQIVVPSLFADLDPEALANRLIPLGEPIPNAGLEAIPYKQRYRSPSILYGSRGWLAPARAGERRPTAEESVLGAAAEGMRDETELPPPSPEGAPA